MTEIRHTIDGFVAELVLDGPAQRNAVDESALRSLAAAVDEIAAAVGANAVRAVILRGEGKVFCAGRDISAVDPRTDDALGFLNGEVAPAIRAIRSLAVPTFASVQGAALGVGFGLAAACDVIYAGESAKFGSPFGAIGAVPDSGAHAFFVDRLGYHRAMDLIYTGELISGTQAAEYGLVSRAIPDAELLDAVRSTAVKVATGPTRAFAASKALAQLYFDQRQPLHDVMTAEAEAQEAARQTKDYLEGFAAFQQKRAPQFEGR
ncbi:enoyl-CoA hydratase-related protein [Saxibacter everestensis]|uniref:Enoyl-CoA hydratase-related protein n=1 Tax=Saxibacter everestensis TaxID=2909229 RepID=A0ABY8QQN6_9MICO|nr:enoyl-CoA hydratase-related protein [Brevibacteriaceae bacterium ZFBP1038]